MGSINRSILGIAGGAILLGVVSWQLRPLAFNMHRVLLCSDFRFTTLVVQRPLLDAVASVFGGVDLLISMLGSTHFKCTKHVVFLNAYTSK